MAQDYNKQNTYDVIVIGAGHAGCEAALAAARMGAETAIFRLTLTVSQTCLAIRISAERPRAISCGKLMLLAGKWESVPIKH